MILSNDKYYILRIGDFATDANTKIYYSLFSLLLCSHDYLYNNSTECFTILYYSTLIWTCIEFCLYISSTREIKPMHLYYNNTSVLVPRYAGIFLQGFQEGGCITTIGLYFGDRLFIFKYLIFLHLLIVFIMFNVFFKKSTRQHSSIRQVNSRGSIILMGIILFVSPANSDDKVVKKSKNIPSTVNLSKHKINGSMPKHLSPQTY